MKVKILSGFVWNGKQMLGEIMKADEDFIKLLEYANVKFQIIEETKKEK